MYVVYQHRRKDNGEVFYVGQGVLKRAYEDIKNRRNSSWEKTVNEAGGFEVDILAEDLTRDESLQVESDYIQKYGTIKHGTGILVNERLSGTRGVESGYKHTEEKKEEIRKKTREAMKNPEVHKRHMESHIAYWNNPESRVKASKAMKGIMAGEKHPNYGKKYSDELRKKLSDAKKGKKRSPEVVEKMKGRIPWNKGLKKIDYPNQT
tara:strand:+ start:370 stop:990 length:621 start_codon:yes stop_codon:yes gene_type:complete